MKKESAKAETEKQSVDFTMKADGEKKNRRPLVLTFFQLPPALSLYGCVTCVFVCVCVKRVCECAFDAGLVPVWLSKGAIRSPY